MVDRQESSEDIWRTQVVEVHPCYVRGGGGRKTLRPRKTKMRPKSRQSQRERLRYRTRRLLRITSFLTNYGDSDKERRVRLWNLSSLQLLVVVRSDHQAGAAYVMMMARRNIRKMDAFLWTARRLLHETMWKQLAWTYTTVRQRAYCLSYTHNDRSDYGMCIVVG